MLMYTPLGSEPLGAAPPGRLAPGWKDRFSARQRITNLFLMHAKGAPQARSIYPCVCRCRAVSIVQSCGLLSQGLYIRHWPYVGRQLP